ncbi:MAG TPA: GHKL domain-containing protein [Candidatus Fournierella merdipullorum]|uniref:GHKL domain-containing protein n=1 Tax=Candidatus Allofournierella merdipullorum TaxID=2838595 RepID=A0A9D2E4L9_9FIRM|nr:GHKL domain-containing protein [Candidatus Fournierella merdipullorum]
MDVYHTLLVAVTQLFLGSYVMLLIDFRKPVRLWRARWLATVTLVVCANLAGLLFLNFWNTYQRIGVLTVTLPYILTTLWCSAYRDFRAVFNLATALFVGSVGAVNSLLAHLFLGDDPYRGPWSLVVRAISFLLMFFLLRRFSFTYRQMLHQLNHRWGILCIIPLATFLAVIYTINRLDVTPAVMVLLYALLAVCACSYYLMYLFFERVQQETDARYESRLASMQLSALQSRMEAVKAAENAVRTERHDLRHRLQAVAQLVARGEQVEALDFLDAAQTRLEEHKVTRWCRPPVLDAVFASCFEQAKSQDIPVEASISLPDELPVDERELAIVVANALDNAIHANLELPVSRRCIRCRAVSTPGVMLEISNPCAGDVTFDSSGLPLARREGHGLGVQSISAFCRKNGAVCRFDLTDGWFRLQLVL